MYCKSAKSYSFIHNVFHKRVAQTSESPTPNQKYYTFSTTTMSPPIFDENVQIEGRILLAIQAIENNQFRSVRAAAAVYDVPRTTLRDRMNGKRSRRVSTPNSRKLSDLEEQVI